MNLHLLLTSEIAATKPETCKIVMDFGQIYVVFSENNIIQGLHCVVEDTKENIIEWLKPYDYFVKGNGNPMLEKFSIVHISESQQ